MVYAPTSIDRRKCHRVVPMKVLVLGLSRTGTDSIRKALQELGYNDTYHGWEAAAENPRDCAIWLDAFRAKYDGKGKVFGREEFDQLLGHCQAVCDGPATCFTPELLAAYPEAKVILSNRDVDDWHNSVNNAIMSNIYNPRAAILSFLARITRSNNRWTRPMFKRVFSDYYDGDFQKNGKQVFEDHYNMVRSLVPKENLLEYRVEEGWGPLCEFLERDTPEMPFPHGNHKEELEVRVGEVIRFEQRRLKGLLTSQVKSLTSAITCSRAGKRPTALDDLASWEREYYSDPKKLEKLSH